MESYYSFHFVACIGWKHFNKLPQNTRDSYILLKGGVSDQLWRFVQEKSRHQIIDRENANVKMFPLTTNNNIWFGKQRFQVDIITRSQILRFKGTNRLPSHMLGSMPEGNNCRIIALRGERTGWSPHVSQKGNRAKLISSFHSSRRWSNQHSGSTSGAADWVQHRAKMHRTVDDASPCCYCDAATYKSVQLLPH